MTTSPFIEIGAGDFQGLVRRLSALPPLFVYFVRGFTTPQDCAAWFAGQRTLFDEVIAWCDDNNWSGRVWMDRDDTFGLMMVAVETETDAVMFKLRWADHLSTPMRHAA